MLIRLVSILLMTTMCAIGCTPTKSISIRLEMEEKNVSCAKNNFAINYFLKNNTADSLIIRDRFMFLYYDPNADFSYTIKKYDDSLNRFVSLPYLLELPPYREEKYTHLLPLETKNYLHNVPCYFFERGRYKIQLKFNHFRPNSALVSYYSNEIEFVVYETYQPTSEIDK